MLKRIEVTMWAERLSYDYLSWAKGIATRLNINGVAFFKNDGSAEIVAEGEERNLIKFVNRLKRGRFFAHFFSPIENFSAAWKEPKKEFETFFISDHSMQEFTS
ncbi:MAG: hypothetical protein UT09_C0005G0001 [Parcubacteria group bacterium GW2011_GWF2_38_8]|nr:MAG: hypothetical protein UT09_C0005G0001 [Parcubacteria group bacterium GW2011_GWF2_38_8]